MLSRFHLIPEHYGRTDRQTDRTAISISRVSVLTRDKNECFRFICFVSLLVSPQQPQDTREHESIMCVAGSLRWWTRQCRPIYNAAAVSCGAKWRYWPGTTSFAGWQWTTSQVQEDLHTSNTACVFCVLAIWLCVRFDRLRPCPYVVLVFCYQYTSKKLNLVVSAPYLYVVISVISNHLEIRQL